MQKAIICSMVILAAISFSDKACAQEVEEAVSEKPKPHIHVGIGATFSFPVNGDYQIAPGPTLNFILPIFSIAAIVLDGDYVRLKGNMKHEQDISGLTNFEISSIWIASKADVDLFSGNLGIRVYPRLVGKDIYFHTFASVISSRTTDIDLEAPYGAYAGPYNADNYFGTMSLAAFNQRSETVTNVYFGIGQEIGFDIAQRVELGFRALYIPYYAVRSAYYINSDDMFMGSFRLAVLIGKKAG